jgi:hypothetical protein
MSNFEKDFQCDLKNATRTSQAINMIWHVPMLQGYQFLAKDIIGREKGGGLIDHYGPLWCFRVTNGKEIMPIWLLRSMY